MVNDAESILQAMSLPEINQLRPEPSVLLENNEAWAKRIVTEYPSFFAESARGQAPRVFWIGCSDSRVPESVITDVFPGAIFVQRNVANQFLESDVSIQAALGFATDAPPLRPGESGGLGVQNVVVVGHSRCGGVAFALDKALSTKNSVPECECMRETPVLNQWLDQLIKLARAYVGGLRKPDPPRPYTEEEKKRMLAELINLNVEEQVMTVHKALKESGKLHVNVEGWVYDLASGLLRKLDLPSPFVE